MFSGIFYLCRYCWKFDKKYVAYLFSRQLITSITALLSLVLPKLIIDSLFVKKDMKVTIYYAVAFVLIVSLLSYIINILSNYILVHRMQVFKKFQIYLGDMVMNTDYLRLEDEKYLNLKEKAYKYLYGNGNGFAHVLEDAFNILGYIITMVGMATIVSRLNPYLVFVMIIIVFINTIAESCIKKKNIQLNLQRASHERRSSYFSNLFSDFRYGKDIRTYNISKWLIKKYDAQLEQMQLIYNKMAGNNIKLVGIQGITSFLQQGLMYFYLIFNTVKGVITIGDFTMFINTINQFVNTLSGFITGIIDLRRYSDYYDSYQTFVDQNNRNETKCGSFKPDLDMDNLYIEFVNVSFKYPGQQDYALKNISIKLPLNQKISIVGENGAGKSTFIKLLTRIYIPTEGKILINDININDIEYDYYIDLFSTVFQDYRLFSMSVEDNIVLDKTKNEERITSILKQIGIYDKIMKLKNGTETYIYKDFDIDGMEPSGGESQKIAIARALYRNSPIIILDEPTSAFDPRAEVQFYQQFIELFENKSILFISHRLSVNLFCDYILVFDKGKLIEKGNLKELLDLKGAYYELYSLQSQFYIKQD